jgi:hypothetical protein
MLTIYLVHFAWPALGAFLRMWPACIGSSFDPLTRARELCPGQHDLPVTTRVVAAPSHYRSASRRKTRRQTWPGGTSQCAIATPHRSMNDGQYPGLPNPPIRRGRTGPSPAQLREIYAGWGG